MLRQNPVIITLPRVLPKGHRTSYKNSFVWPNNNNIVKRSPQSEMQWKISISSPPQRHTLDELDTHRPYSNSHLAACVLRSRVPKTQRLFFPKRAARVASDPRQIQCGWAREPRPPLARPLRFELSKTFRQTRSCDESNACWCCCLWAFFLDFFPSMSLATGRSNLSSVIVLAAARTWGA